MLTATYRKGPSITAQQVAELESLETQDVDLEEIALNCLKYDTCADLYDDAGFHKGWVSRFGQYYLG